MADRHRDVLYESRQRDDFRDPDTSEGLQVVQITTDPRKYFFIPLWTAPVTSSWRRVLNILKPHFSVRLVRKAG